MSQESSPPGNSLPRVLGLGDAIAIVVGSIIGSGIFLTKAGIVATQLPSFALILFVWIFVGLVTLCGSLALAELAAMLPHAGGPYVYLREAYGRLPAFLWGWTEFWIIRTGSLGALACASAIYLAAAFPSIGRAGQEAVAISVIVGLTLVNAAGVRLGAGVQNFTVIIKCSFLAMIIVLPLLLGKAQAANVEPIWPAEEATSLASALGIAMIAVLWPYDGWINLAPLAEEVKEPQRNVPRALTIGMLIVIALYAGAITSYHLVLPMKDVQESTAVASDVCAVLFGPTGRTIAALAVVCSTFGACNSNLLCGPRIYFALARDGLLPRQIGAVQSRLQTPANAILLQGTWAVVLVLGAFHGAISPESKPSDAFDKLTNLVIFGGWLFYALAVGAVFVLRWKRPDLPRPYRTVGYPITPAIYLLAAVALMFSLLWEYPGETAVGSILIGLGALAYGIALWRRPK